MSEPRGSEAANTAAQHPGIVSQNCFTEKCPGYKPGQLLAAAAGRYSNIIQHYYCKRFCRFCQGYSGKKIKIPEGVRESADLYANKIHMSTPR